MEKTFLPSQRELKRQRELTRARAGMEPAIKPEMNGLYPVESMCKDESQTKEWYGQLYNQPVVEEVMGRFVCYGCRRIELFAASGFPPICEAEPIATCPCCQHPMHYRSTVYPESHPVQQRKRYDEWREQFFSPEVAGPRRVRHAYRAALCQRSGAPHA